jgi:hypothetical protein
LTTLLEGAVLCGHFCSFFHGCIHLHRKIIHAYDEYSKHRKVMYPSRQEGSHTHEYSKHKFTRIQNKKTLFDTYSCKHNEDANILLFQRQESKHIVHNFFTCSLSRKSSLPSFVSNNLRTSLPSGFMMSNVVVCLRVFFFHSTFFDHHHGFCKGRNLSSHRRSR